MKKLMILASVFLLVFGVAAVASATSFTLGSYAIDSNDDYGLLVETSNVLAQPYVFDFSSVDSITVALFDVWTPESDVGRDDRVPQDIEVMFNFTAPEALSVDVLGQTVGNYSGAWFLNAQWGSVEWENAGTSFTFSDGSALSLYLSDEIFNWGLYGLWGDNCFGATVDLTVEYSTTPVPEPATMLLLGTGLLGLAGVGRKKYFKK